jgi:hypothetical protein
MYLEIHRNILLILLKYRECTQPTANRQPAEAKADPL